MDNNEEKSEIMPSTEEKAEEKAFSRPPEPPAQKPKRKISVGLSVFITVIAMFITFQSTYIVMSEKSKLAINEARGEIAKYGDLFDMIDIFKKNYIYDVDDELINDGLLHAYAYYSGDKYAVYYNSEEWSDFVNQMNGNNVGIGVYVTSVKNGIEVLHVMTGTPAEKAGFMKGDIIVAIDGNDISEMAYNDAVNLVAGEVGSQVLITVKRGDEKINLTATRENYEAQTVIADVFEREGKKVGYIHITNFYSVTTKQFIAAVEAAKREGCEALIFDVRGNPGGELAAVCNILDYLLPEGPIVRTFRRDGDKLTQETVEYKSGASCIDLPMVVLADGNSASAAELFTSALRDYNKITLVGTNTYGKGCGQSGFAVGDGYLMVTSFLYAPPFSDNYDGKGIAPDIEVELSEEYKNKNIMSLTLEQDAQLLAALEEAFSKIK